MSKADPVGSASVLVETAVSLARDIDRLRDPRRTMRDRLLASALMDHRGFARKLEDAYRCMWRRWCKASAEREESAK